MDELKQVKRLYSFRGYFEYYFEIFPKYNRGLAAYEAIEREFYELFGANRYADYAVFRKMKRKYILVIQAESRQRRKILRR
jgi:hypothetical protein